MTQNASTYSASPTLAYAIGGSAGGNLALATALKLSSIPGSSTPKAVLASCSGSCEPSAIPDKYREAWHPELFLDSAFLDRTCMQTCIGRSFSISDLQIECGAISIGFGLLTVK